MPKLLWFAVGYVLGTRAGRERYEQIVSAATLARGLAERRLTEGR